MTPESAGLSFTPGAPREARERAIWLASLLDFAGKAHERNET